jgi:hypothetical protein
MRASRCPTRLSRNGALFSRDKRLRVHWLPSRHMSEPYYGWAVDAVEGLNWLVDLDDWAFRETP